jgi:putative ABC transport system permease protein
MLSLFRPLARAPGFALAATAVAALGIGAATGIFSVIDAVLLDPLSPEEDRLVVLYRAEPGTAAWPPRAISLPDVNDWRREASVFEELGAFGGAFGTYSIGDGDSTRAREARGVLVTHSFFDTMGVRPVLGRGFLPEEAEPDAEGVVMISYRLWQSVLGGNPDVLGQTLALEVSKHFTIVGVMPPGFCFPNQADLWTPARFEPPINQREWDFLFVVGKLAPGANAEEARAELEVIDQRVWKDTRESARNVRVATATLSDFAFAGSLRSTVGLLVAAVGLLVVVTAMNLLGLCLVRSLARRREITVRAALGATGFARIGGSLAETGLVCALGALVGAFLARSGLSLLVAFGPEDVPRLDQATFGTQAVAFAFLLTVALFLAVSAASAFAASRWSVAMDLSAAASASQATHRAGQVFSIFQIGATVYLVIAAVFLSGSLLRLSRQDLGFDPDRVLVFEVARELTLDDEVNADAQRHMIRELLPRLEAIPDVRSAGVVAWPPMSGMGWYVWFATEEQGFGFADRDPTGAPDKAVTIFVPPTDEIERNPRVNWQSISNNYFRVVGISLLEGRAFDEGDTEVSPRVVIVGEGLAARQWPSESALGKRMITYGYRHGANGRPEWQTVVGVVSDARYGGIDRTSLDVYVPLGQSQMLAPHSFVLRTKGDPLAIVPSVRARVRELDPSFRLERVRTLQSDVSHSLLPWRFNAILVAFFAGAALILAAAGIFSLLAQNVSHRTRELGIRLALGATPSSILRLVFGLGLRLLLWGIGTGLGLAWSTSRFLEAHLYGLTPTDPGVYAIAAVVVIFVALLACSVPAVSATKTNPTIALRHE